VHRSQKVLVQGIEILEVLLLVGRVTSTWPGNQLIKALVDALPDFSELSDGLVSIRFCDGTDNVLDHLGYLLQILSNQGYGLINVSSTTPATAGQS
jgi:hypothetical protein